MDATSVKDTSMSGHAASGAVVSGLCDADVDAEDEGDGDVDGNAEADGGADCDVSIENAYYLAKNIPRAEFYAFHGKGHMPVFTATSEFCEVLRQFILTGTVPSCGNDKI